MVQSPLAAQGVRRNVMGQGTAGQIALWVGNGRIGNSAVHQDPDGSVSVSGTPQVALTGETTSTVGATGVVGISDGDSGPFATGVYGRAGAHPNGIGVFGTAVQTGVQGETSGTGGYPIGVLGFGQSSPTGIGVSGFGSQTGTSGIASGTSGFTVGLNGMSVANPSGLGGQIIGAGTGIRAITQNCNNSGIPGGCATAGTAGDFVTGAGGTILLGREAVGNTWTPTFRVDSTGRGYFNGGTQVGGADFAESIHVAKSERSYSPGDLLVVDDGADRQLALASQPYSTRVAGIHSTKPGILATRHGLGAASSEIPVAVVGIVPCKVSAENGPIHRGDLLVSSSTAGHAMRGTDRGRMLGALVGKALQNHGAGEGVIEVLVTLQ
jgi:hypothetical protein